MRYKVKSKNIDLQASSFNAGRILPFFSGYAYHLMLVKLYSAFLLIWLVMQS
ncbi:hypothetical protein HMPREF9019_2225 [Hoylesella timonensis CRIS 5C-B1]|uniref:Uncharacterized protein n=1 Tax=Hoylesella timonensis CRIS 5C-B1 TaxID=679189 RepID=D1VWU7_9BACT|nr:hypothetical protein HMPREF9019_2225 [Hoylesella timonensis CRIS 5C-B1]